MKPGLDTNIEQTKESRTANRRLAQWRVQWLIEHSTSHQLLWYIDSEVPQTGASILLVPSIQTGACCSCHQSSPLVPFSA